MIVEPAMSAVAFSEYSTEYTPQSRFTVPPVVPLPSSPEPITYLRGIMEPVVRVLPVELKKA